MLWAALLTVDGEPAAFSFDMNLGALKYAIANSYDPAFAKHSPGKLLYYRNLVRALDDGMTTVDWGAGDSGYKRVIGADKGPAIRDWLLLRPGVPALLGQVLKGMWRRSGQFSPCCTAIAVGGGAVDHRLDDPREHFGRQIVRRVEPERHRRVALASTMPSDSGSAGGAARSSPSRRSAASLRPAG